MDPVVELIGVSRRFGGSSGRLALCEVSLAVPRGSFVAVMGATGSGKSTLLHCAAGLDRPTAGTVRLAGRDITRMREAALTRLRRDRVGFVFQSYNLLSELTVARKTCCCRPGSAARGRPAGVAEVLDAGRPRRARRRPVGELSGGQRQRVAVARALVTRPAVVFADEPTGALDPTTGGQVLRPAARGRRPGRLTVVMVSHDPPAAAVSDRLLLLRDGRLVADGATPDAATIAARLRAVSTDRTGRPPGRVAGGARCRHDERPDPPGAARGTAGRSSAR